MTIAVIRRCRSPLRPRCPWRVKETWLANDACAALQIVNHLQDCAKDYRELTAPISRGCARRYPGRDAVPASAAGPARGPCEPRPRTQALLTPRALRRPDPQPPPQPRCRVIQTLAEDHPAPEDPRPAQGRVHHDRRNARLAAKSRHGLQPPVWLKKTECLAAAQGLLSPPPSRRLRTARSIRPCA